MHRVVTIALASIALLVSMTQPAPAKGKRGKKKLEEFKKNTTGKAGLGGGVKASKLKPTRTEGVLKFTVVDKDKGPIKGLVMSLTDRKSKKVVYTNETDAKGYTEILVPVGRVYELVYLSLGRRKIAARLPVENEPALVLRLTLRYKRFEAERRVGGKLISPKFVLRGVEFDTGKATIRKSSYGRLDQVVTYMTHKTSSVIEISGHTDSVGNSKKNKKLSLRRAKACRKYLMKKGIAGTRIIAAGYGSEQPIASNSTSEGRQQNRRIEVKEI
ncbi:MAG: OmpA family protein [Deltaproteobacteria bacterium]|nr:OmpA family protein [Deltaproteobacteria bacterium]